MDFPDAPLPEKISIFIMAGGTGERFWPLSRIGRPKHLLRLLGDRTLLEEAVSRALGVTPAEDVFVLTNETQLPACRDAAGGLLPSENFVAEPAKRDTAPAAALATAISRRRHGARALCGLLPADAMIHDTPTFCRQLRDAARAASASDALFTFAIPPASASTAFGYLELGDESGRGEGGSAICAVNRFVEKPDPDTAEEYVSSGRYGWNAGMFLWRADRFAGECARQVPALAEFIADFPEQPGDGPGFIASRFPKLPKISVDYAIMENASRVCAVKAEFDWDDVGSWTALPAHLGADADRNTLRGASAVHDSFNNVVVSTGRTVALCGVSDLVVVETEDAVLVCHRNSAQRVKNLQPLLPEALR